MQTGFFFSSFPSSKKKHAYTNIILTKKLHVIQTKKLTCKLEFFSNFLAQKKKNSMHIPTSFSQTSFSQKKKISWYSNQEINMKTGLFSSFPTQKNIMHIPTSFSQKNCIFQFSSLEKWHAYTNIILTKKKNYMLFKPRNQHANWIFFFNFPTQKNSMHKIQHDT